MDRGSWSPLASYVPVLVRSSISMDAGFSPDSPMPQDSRRARNERKLPPRRHTEEALSRFAYDDLGALDVGVGSRVLSSLARSNVACTIAARQRPRPARAPFEAELTEKKNVYRPRRHCLDVCHHRQRSRKVSSIRSAALLLLLLLLHLDNNMARQEHTSKRRTAGLELPATPPWSDAAPTIVSAFSTRLNSWAHEWWMTQLECARPPQPESVVTTRAPP